MKICMFTNTYKPHVGGVARLVEFFAEDLANDGHRVLVVAPAFSGAADDEEVVLRIPAIQEFNGRRDSPLPKSMPSGRSDACVAAPDGVGQQTGDIDPVQGDRFLVGVRQTPRPLFPRIAGRPRLRCPSLSLESRFSE